jgi:undecaprenyl-diphosphatase
VALAAGAFVLFAAERVQSPRRPEGSLTARDAVLIGVAQAAALIPGVSRSGATIGAGMLLGYERQDVARFTFLLSVPAILAAAASKGFELRHATLSLSELHAFAIGIGTSAVVGYLAVKYFIQFVGRHRLDAFAWYRLALATVLILIRFM